MILALRLSNSAFIFAMVPSSVVHTGVKSFGCENRTTHLSPIHSWKSIGPSVVRAWKFGVGSPMRSAIDGLLGAVNYSAAPGVLQSRKQRQFKARARAPRAPGRNADRRTGRSAGRGRRRAVISARP